MKLLFFLFAIFSINANAQTDLKFDTSFLESQKKWISLPISKDSTHFFGFVYLDNMAGLTFQLEGSFKIDNTNKIILTKQPKTSIMKTRITPTNLKVAVIPSSYYDDLQITEQPDWLKFYDTDENNIHRAFRLGSTYNAWRQGEKALSYLLKVEEANPDYPNLAFELVYANNALKQFVKAEKLVLAYLKKSPNNCLLYKELVYAQIQMKEPKKATSSLEAALVACEDKNIRNELFRNVVYYYFTTKDKEQFTFWYKKAKDEANGDQKALQILEMWNKNLNP